MSGWAADSVMVCLHAHVCAASRQEMSSDNITPDNQNSSASVGPGELPPGQNSLDPSEALQKEQSSKAITHLHMYLIVFEPQFSL